MIFDWSGTSRNGGKGRKCARFVQDHAREIANAIPGIPEDLNDRAEDIWEPLLAVADLAGKEWGEKARHAAVSLTAKAQEDNPIGSLPAGDENPKVQIIKVGESSESSGSKSQ